MVCCITNQERFDQITHLVKINVIDLKDHKTSQEVKDVDSPGTSLSNAVLHEAHPMQMRRNTKLRNFLCLKKKS